MTVPLSRAERDAIVNEYWESERSTTTPNVQHLTSQQVRAAYAKQDTLLAEYGRRLPRVRASRCPYCAGVLEFTFDAFGLDGMWWAREGIVETAVPTDPHFTVLLGAIDFHGREPVEARPNGRVLPGPAVPFVVPRLLELPRMIVVISTLDLPHGDTAFLMAYFSDAPLAPGDLHQCWGRETFTVPDENGDLGWTAATDRWDFDLQPWVGKGCVMWIDPGDTSFAIQNTGRCPYIDLPGRREPQVIEVGKLSTLPLPDGEPFDPFG
jgi:hypothetical protein